MQESRKRGREVFTEGHLNEERGHNDRFARRSNSRCREGSREDRNYKQTEHKIPSSIGVIHHQDRHGTYQEDYQMDSSRRSNTHELTTEVLKPEIQKVFNQPEVLNRNKRIFGSLMGHLGRAKLKLEQDTALLAMQNDKSNAIAERLAQETRLAQEKKKRQAIQVAVDAKIKVILDYTEIWKSRLKSLDHLLFTEVVPKLSWAPGSHNSTTRELLAKRISEV
jgi:hypothetical protein